MLQDENHNRLSKTFWLAVAASIGIFIVNIAGFVDTITASTVGCGKSWPLCNGKLAPWEWDYHAWIEFGHRFLVFMASVLLVSISIVAWRKYGEVKRVRTFILLALLGVVLESFLGAMAVFFMSPPALLAVHMGIALLSFGSLCALTLTIRQLDQPELLPKQEVSSGLSRFTWFTLFFLYIAIYFGSYVASRGSGGAFRGFPFPSETFEVAGIHLIIDIIHRLFALGLLILLIALVVATFKIKRERPTLYKGSVLGLILICLQGFSGWLLIFSKLNMYAILLHVAIISLMFGVMSMIATATMKQPKWDGVRPKKKRSNKEGKASSVPDEMPSNV